MDQEHLRKLDDLYLKGKLKRLDHEKKYRYEISKLLETLKKLNEIGPTDPDHEEVMKLSWEIMELQDKIRREEAVNIFPALEKCKNFFFRRLMKK